MVDEATTDTDRVDMLAKVLEQLVEMNRRLTNIEADVQFLRAEQIKAGRRLRDIEEICEDRPLRSTPPPKPLKAVACEEGRGDER